MTALLNHVPVPFFDRIPPRAKPAMIAAFDGIIDQHMRLESVYRTFVSALDTVNVEGPQFSEFADWYWKVREGFIDRPHPSEIYCVADESAAQTTPQPHPVETNEEVSLMRSFGIVKAARSLFEAQLKAGYTSPTLRGDDEIIADALRNVLSAAADATVMDADIHMTPGNKIVDLLLGEGSPEIDQKLFECLTMAMQPELCAILVKLDQTARH
ncbi:hypothetical protein ACTOV4_07065 [Brucella sp. C7-11G]